MLRKKNKQGGGLAEGSRSGLGLPEEEVVEVGAVGPLGIGLQVLEQPRLPELHRFADHVEDGGSGLVAAAARILASAWK